MVHRVHAGHVEAARNEPGGRHDRRGPPEQLLLGGQGIERVAERGEEELGAPVEGGQIVARRHGITAEHGLGQEHVGRAHAARRTTHAGLLDVRIVGFEARQEADRPVPLGHGGDGVRQVRQGDLDLAEFGLQRGVASFETAQLGQLVGLRDGGVDAPRGHERQDARCHEQRADGAPRDLHLPRHARALGYDDNSPPASRH